MSQWPPWVGSLHQLTIPRGIVPHAQPAPVGGANINIILHLLGLTRDVPGDLAECGVFRGSTLVPVALELTQQKSAKHIYGFDSFEGFPDEVQYDMSLESPPDSDKRMHGLDETSYELVLRKIARFRLTNATLMKGYFNQTFPACEARSFSFVHLDCDIYSSYKECLEFFYPRLSSGGIVLLDEYNDPPWPGCNQAVDEFLADKPERVREINRDNFLKYYFVKA